VLVGQEATLEAALIGRALVEQFLNVVGPKHGAFLLPLVDLDAALLAGGAAVALVVEGRLPVLEEVRGDTHIVVLFCSGLCGQSLELRGLYQSVGVPRGQSRHAVQGSQFELGVDVADVNFCLPGLFLGVAAGGLGDGVGLFEPVACVEGDLPMRTRGLYPSQI
jgi:hypothetical protein